MKPAHIKFFALIAMALFFSINIFAQTNREKGIELFRKADYKNAVKTLKKAAGENSSDFQSQYYLGLSYIKIKSYKDAAKVLRKAVELDKNSSEAFAALAYSYLLQNDVNNADINAQTALKLNPKNHDGHYILGVSSLRRGSFNLAYERAKKTIELKPDFSLAYYLKTEALINSFGLQGGTIVNPIERRYELLSEAAESLQKYLSLAPNDKDFAFLSEYLESLKFFVQYYEKPENRKPINFDPVEPQNNNTTGLKITFKPKPQYTDDAREAAVSGNVRVLAVFGADGKIQHTLVTKTLGYGLDEQAIRAAKTIRFEPEMKDGKPITVVKTIVFNFAIYDRIML